MSNCCQLPIKLIDRRVDRRENNKTKRRAGWEKVNEQLKFVKFWASKTGSPDQNSLGVYATVHTKDGIQSRA